MMKKVTRDDVAKLAGVSSSVVSYVLNGTNYVSEDKKKRVLQAVEQLHYTPNVFARSLRRGNSRQIALIGDSLEADLFRRVSDKLYAAGYQSMLFYSMIEDSFIDRVISMQFDAIFLTSNGFSTNQLNRIAESGTPIVLYRSRDYGELSERISVVVPDIQDSIRKSVDYLVLRGHRRFGYIPPLLYRTKGLEDDDYRTRAFKRALESHDIAPDMASYCIHTRSLNDILSDVFEMITSGERSQMPDALVVGEDQIAAQIILYLQKLGLQIPQNIAVVGWGDTPVSSMVRPLLTTVAYDVDHYSQEVVQELIRLTEGGKALEKRTPVRLVIRESA